MTTAGGPVQAIAEEQARLARELRTLPPPAWAAPSRCDGWSNAAVVGHLALHAAVYQDSIARALRGDSGPPSGPDGQPQTREEFLARADNDHRALAQMHRVDLLRELGTYGDQLVEELEPLEPADLDRGAWHYAGPATIGILVAYRLYELAFHGWDVRSTVDPAATIRPELCPFVLGTVRQLLPLLCAPKSTIEATCRFEVDGQVWTTHVGDGKLVEVSDPGEPDAVVRTGASTFLLLATMRQTLAECGDRIAIEGSRDLAERMLDVSHFRV